MDSIIIKGAREHNLKNIDVTIPKNKLVVFTGLSGSGKSSLAFDTIYAEGQRRYVESLSSYARQFLGVMKKPDVDLIEGLSPAISIDQKGASHNPRSTVGTVTEIYDYLRLLFARVGHPHCPNCGREISHLSKEQITNSIFGLLDTATPRGIRLLLLSPIVKDRKGEYIELFSDLKKQGYKKVRVDGQIFRLDEDLVLIKTNKHTIELVVDQISLTKKIERIRVSNGVEQGLKFGNGELIIAIIEDKGFEIPEKPKKMANHLFSEKFACPTCNISMSEVEPRIFSFNTPHGACPECNGLGTVLMVDRHLVLNDNLTIMEGGILPFANQFSHNTWFSRTFMTFCEENDIPTNVRLEKISQKKKDLLLEGTGEREYEVFGQNRWGKETAIVEKFRGVLLELKNKYQESDSMHIRSQVERFMRYETCKTCSGGRLKKESLSITINSKSIVEVSNLSILDCLDFIKSLKQIFSQREMNIAKLILKEIQNRLEFLTDVGLEYLTLARGARSLAGGEAQRIRLASQIGSGLTGVLYVLDEPSIGLHQRDNKKLINTLKKLRDLGNTLLVVEHDQETMEEADHIIDLDREQGRAVERLLPKVVLKSSKKTLIR